MHDVGSCALLGVAVLCGAFVSGLAGFAFLAVAGVILLHILQPIEAIPLMMASSVGVQATNLWALRQSIRWKESFLMVLGGVFGIPVAIWLLGNIDPRLFRQCFGLIVGGYSAYMLFRSKRASLQQSSPRQNALIGFGSGLIGGLTTMPGALPTIWCDLHGVPKEQQ